MGGATDDYVLRASRLAMRGEGGRQLPMLSMGGGLIAICCGCYLSVGNPVTESQTEPNGLAHFHALIPCSFHQLTVYR